VLLVIKDKFDVIFIKFNHLYKYYLLYYYFGTEIEDIELDGKIRLTKFKQKRSFLRRISHEKYR